ncbi:BTB/POZ domain-containing protein [Aspergillus fijiensis CBS 313.89]|uniref:BTB domain-containing protein n=1 Tax=Aspergillus fijiensis CBS 313.89 TaxID=1448319 RepID=A0A8G1RMR7_9EURO|nr:uncharacterized protein BO72DRAFT_529656 [Aspergillus fijiensis CBS 313.89]RAK75023.1 hypothetical protein BO72DRAFT_529656 [Aspergillus fijiensis CBS 313.89]
MASNRAQKKMPKRAASQDNAGVQPKRPKPSIASIKVLVGPRDTMYRIPEQKARSSSEFFDKALEGTWKEGTQRTVRLPDVDPRTFGKYFWWLYHPAYTPSSEFKDLVKAYILADRLMDNNFGNQLMNAIVTRLTGGSGGYRSPPSKEEMEFVWQTLPPLTPLYRLLVDFEVHVGSFASSWLKDNGVDKGFSAMDGEKLSREDWLTRRFMLQVMSTAMTRFASIRPQPFQISASDYHRAVGGGETT